MRAVQCRSHVVDGGGTVDNKGSTGLDVGELILERAADSEVHVSAGEDLGGRPRSRRQLVFKRDVVRDE